VRLTYVSIGYLLLAVVSGVVYGFGGTILKKGVGFSLEGGIFAVAARIVTSKYILLSLFCSATGYLLYMFIIRKAEIIPTTLIIQGVLFVATMAFASLLYKEAITPAKIVAALLIAAGIGILVLAK
jgi:drug/metabolite transporter (DMT)-like permease